MLPSLHDIRDEIRDIANHIEKDYPASANKLRTLSNAIEEHAREEATFDEISENAI